jgi:hypothetical protein
MDNNDNRRDTDDKWESLLDEKNTMEAELKELKEEIL